MNDTKNTLHDISSVLAIVVYTSISFYYYNISGLIISISTIVIGLIFIKRKYITKAINDILSQLKNSPSVKKVICSIIIFATVGSVFFYSYKPPEDQSVVVAISKFCYMGAEQFDIGKADAKFFQKKIESEEGIAIKVIFLDKEEPACDYEAAKSLGEKYGAHMLVYGEKINNDEKVYKTYNVLILANIKNLIVMPSQDVKEKNGNYIVSEEAVFYPNNKDTIKFGDELFEENASILIKLVDAQIKYEKSNFTSAITSFKSIKNYENYSGILFYIANSYYYNNNLNESLQYFNDSIRLNPQSSEALNNKGVVLNDLKRYSEANETLDEAIQVDSTDATTWINKGVALKGLGDLKGALSAYENAIKIDPKLEYAWFNKGNTLQDLGNYTEAIISYNNAIEINPDDFDVWNNKGNALSSLGRYEDAIIAYNRGIKINQKVAVLWNNKGDALEHLKNPKEALEAFDNAIKINPELEVAWFNKGNNLLISGNYVDAIKAFDRAILINQNYSGAWNSRGLAYLNLRNYTEASASFDNAIKADPKSAVAWNNKGLALQGLGNLKEALEAFDNAINMYPNYADAWYNKGCTLSELRDDKEAIIAFDKAIQINPQIERGCPG